MNVIKILNVTRIPSTHNQVFRDVSEFVCTVISLGTSEYG